MRVKCFAPKNVPLIKFVLLIAMLVYWQVPFHLTFPAWP